MVEGLLKKGLWRLFNRMLVKFFPEHLFGGSAVYDSGSNADMSNSGRGVTVCSVIAKLFSMNSNADNSLMG